MLGTPTTRHISHASHRYWKHEVFCGTGSIEENSSNQSIIKSKKVTATPPTPHPRVCAGWSFLFVCSVAERCDGIQRALFVCSVSERYSGFFEEGQSLKLPSQTSVHIHEKHCLRCGWQNLEFSGCSQCDIQQKHGLHLGSQS